MRNDHLKITGELPLAYIHYSQFPIRSDRAGKQIKKISIIFFIPLLILSKAFAQHKPADSTILIKNLIWQTRSEQEKLKLFLKLGDRYLDTYGEEKPNSDSAIFYLKKALGLSLRTKDIAMQNRVMRSVGEYEFQTGNTREGRKFFKQVIGHYQKTGEIRLEADAWSLLAEQLYSYEKVNERPERNECVARAGKLYAIISDQFRQLELHIWLVRDYREDRKFKQAESECLLMKDGFKKMKYYGEGYGWVLNMLVDIAVEKSDLYKQLYYELENLSFILQHPEHSTVFAEEGCYYHLGLIYLGLENYAKSEYYARKQLPLVLKLRGDYTFCLQNLVTSLIRQGKPRDALTVLQKIVEEHPPDLSEKVKVFKLMGNIYLALHEFKSAEQSYLTSLKNYEALDPGHKRLDFLVSVYQPIGDFYVATARFEKAAQYYKYIGNIKFSLPPLKKSHLALMQSKVDSASGNYLPALQLFQFHKRITDSIFNTQKSAQLNQLEVSFETRQKETRIDLLSAQNKVHLASMHEAKTERNITIAGILLMLIIFGLMLNGFKNKSESNRQLRISEEKINKQNASLQYLLAEKDALLADKEMLLKEVHHRVKNNLQIVMSLLSTQLSYMESKEVRDALEESQQRVYSIALIHHKLYTEIGGSSIEMKAYIHDLIENLDSCLSASGRGICFKKTVDFMHLPIDLAIPTGLILNEAITNAIKYAFKGSCGTISVTMNRTSEHYVHLSISDDGKGLPPCFDLETSNSLGMEMMKGLGKQLQGTLQINDTSGVTVSLAFPVDVQDLD